MDDQEKAAEFIPPYIGIESDQKGHISIKSNIVSKIMIKHMLEMTLEIVVADIVKESQSPIYVPGPNGMPLRRT